MKCAARTAGRHNRSSDQLPGSARAEAPARTLRAVLDGETALFVDLAVRLGDELAAMEAPYVAGDAREGFNPTHDVCRMIIDAAVRRARRSGAPPRR